jgi:predicted nucleic acid-binding protein
VKVFFDSNIWVYSFGAGNDPRNARAAKYIDDAVIDDDEIFITHQTVAEVTNVLRKQANEEIFITATIASFARFAWARPELTTLQQAYVLATQHSISWYDATLVQAAIDAGCERFYSEDLQHGRTFGALTIVNPFLD